VHKDHHEQAHSPYISGVLHRRSADDDRERSTASGCRIRRDAAERFIRPLLGSGMPEAYRLRLNPVQKILKRS
jgi:hypothetical protein